MPQGKYFVRYLRTRCFCIRNRKSERSERVTFLIRQNLMRKYRTPALSISKWVFSIAELSQDLKPDFTKAPQSSLL